MIFSWIVIVCWLIFLVYWFIAATTAKRTVRNRTGMWIVSRIVITIAALFVVYADRLIPLGNPFNTIAVQSIGTLIVVLGLLLCLWARRTIGNNWGMPMDVKESPHLVETGPYAYIRHPIYAGAILMLFGSGLVTGPWWLVLMIVVSAHFIYSAFVEEKQLAQTFGEKYLAYKRRSAMLIPHIL